MKWLILILGIFIQAIPCHAAPLSPEEKAGQVLMVHFRGEEANREAQDLILEAKVGDIIYYNWANGLHSFEQVRKLSHELQRLAGLNEHPIPLFIAADQEGGRVCRLNRGFTIFPGNMALGRTGQPELAFDAALAMGEEMLSAGVNMNLAPVVDINSNPKNQVIGSRSFSSNPKEVSAFAKCALAGYQKAGVMPVLKHYPGHGDVETDSHVDLPIMHKSLQEMEQCELLPFRELSPYADAIMTAHLLSPLDPAKCATISKKSLDYLKRRIGFNGLVIADSLIMEGIIKQCQSVDNAAIEALNAGCDILILGGLQLNGEKIGYELTTSDVRRIHKAIVQAVKEGRVPEERLDEAVSKILKYKKQYAPTRDQANIKIDMAQNRRLAQKIAEAAYSHYFP